MLKSRGRRTPNKGNIMEVIREKDATKIQLYNFELEGCKIKKYTINGEKWLYIIHPAKSKRKTHE